VTDFGEAVVTIISSLEPGDVVTYGEVAAEAGHPGAARAVGNLLRAIDADLPWWRVVGAGGRLRSPDVARQARLLAADGVLVIEGRVMIPAGRE
jgi:methylated-DNA-protein-cysteine methyltransferase related protein